MFNLVLTYDVYTEFPEYESIWLNLKVKSERIQQDHIECKICNRQLEKLSNTHLKLHNITMDEYKEKYPYSNIINNRLFSISSETAKKSNATREYTYRSKAENEIIEFLI